MAEVKDLSNPVRNGSIELVELAGEKVIHAFNDDQMIFARE